MEIDLNSDLGESFAAWRMGDDAAMLEIVTSANIACGFHAGDPGVMARTLAAAAAKGVAVGAHPSFWDLPGFGRRPIQGEDPADIRRQCLYQIGALAALAKAEGQSLQHVKAHGALYNQAADDPKLARALAEAAAAIDPRLILVVLPGSAMEKAAREVGIAVACEVFADRAYDEAGRLVARRLPGAVIEDAELAAARVVRMVQSQSVPTQAGRELGVRIDTVCVHGDNPAAVGMAATIRAALAAEGIGLRPMGERRDG